tara:strand:- start:4076 stop:4606 length:531 start_codon:yes stop_codon:yes gene_type:complete
MKPQIITQDHIRELIPPVGTLPKGKLRYVLFSDSSYSMFTETFLTRDGFTGFKKWLNFCGIEASGQKLYWKRNYDCDNLANAFKTYMNLLHAKANPFSFTEGFKTGKSNETSAEGVAIGVVYFEMRNKKSASHHAINVAVTNGLRGDPTLIYIEPNGAGKIKLTKRERESIWYVNF